MEMRIQFGHIPDALNLEQIKHGLAEALDEDGWLTGSGQTGTGAYIELELEEERVNPKYGILTVKNYLQTLRLPPETALEMAGLSIGLYE